MTRMMKPEILKAGTKYQIGEIPRHGIEEHLIVLKSFIMLRMKKKNGVVIQLVDYKKFFDSERLTAIMASLNTAKVREAIEKKKRINYGFLP